MGAFSSWKAVHPVLCGAFALAGYVGAAALVALAMSASVLPRDAVVGTFAADLLAVAIASFFLFQGRERIVRPSVFEADAGMHFAAKMAFLNALCLLCVWLTGQLSAPLLSVFDSPAGIEAMEAALSNPLYIALALLAAPLLEEMVFRGGLFANLAATRLGASGAALLSSLAFAFMHATAMQFPATLSLGLFQCFVYLQTRSVWPCVGVHVAYNVCALCFGSLGLDVPVLVSCGAITLNIVFSVFLFFLIGLFSVEKAEGDFPNERSESDKRVPRVGDDDFVFPHQGGDVAGQELDGVEREAVRDVDVGVVGESSALR